MLNHDAVDADHPATNIVISGNTATFEAFRMKWTVVDGGRGYESTPSPWMTDFARSR